LDKLLADENFLLSENSRVSGRGGQTRNAKEEKRPHRHHAPILWSAMLLFAVEIGGLIIAQPLLGGALCTSSIKDTGGDDTPVSGLRVLRTIGTFLFSGSDKFSVFSFQYLAIEHFLNIEN
jgi:hypothetical protein